MEYGINGLILTATGNSTLFVDGGNEKQKQYIHRVWLKNLTPNTKYSKWNNFLVICHILILLIL